MNIFPTQQQNNTFLQILKAENNFYKTYIFLVCYLSDTYIIDRISGMFIDRLYGNSENICL